MTDPADLLRRADALSKQSESEPDPQVRERLLRMSAYYTEIAQLEESLANRAFELDNK